MHWVGRQREAGEEDDLLQAIWVAAELGIMEVMNRLLDEERNKIDAPSKHSNAKGNGLMSSLKLDTHGQRPIHLAAERGYDRVVTFLAQKSVDLNALGKH